MKKVVALLFTIFFSTISAKADFIRFGTPYGMGNWYSNQIFMRNSMNPYLNPSMSPTYTSYYDDCILPTYNDYSNPYTSAYENPLANLFKKATKKYDNKNINDNDIEYLLSKMEKNKFGTNYSNQNIENRLDRLDSQMFGTIQAGDTKTRLNRLKHAFSAQASREYKNRTQNKNRFRDTFSSGYPTSMPASNDYYSSLEQDFHSWE